MSVTAGSSFPVQNVNLAQIDHWQQRICGLREVEKAVGRSEGGVKKSRQEQGVRYRSTTSCAEKCTTSMNGYGYGDST